MIRVERIKISLWIIFTIKFLKNREELQAPGVTGPKERGIGKRLEENAVDVIEQHAVREDEV